MTSSVAIASSAVGTSKHRVPEADQSELQIGGGRVVLDNQN